MNARERIPSFCDEGTFYEYGALAGGKHPGGREPLPGDDLVGGTARISGRYLVIIAEDFTVKGGSIGHPNAAKRTQIKGSELENFAIHITFSLTAPLSCKASMTLTP
ncbi:MAG: hypothetical protein IPG06_11765 [Haliea sp.]|nr:hypothetical protein [Haliea sp.]